VFVLNVVYCLLLVLYVCITKCYLDKILNSDEVTSVAVLYPTRRKIHAKSLTL